MVTRKRALLSDAGDYNFSCMFSISLRSLIVPAIFERLPVNCAVNIPRDSSWRF